MQIKVYDGERFERNKLWYVIFATVFASVFVLSIVNQNWVGTVILFFLLGAYLYYSLIGSQIIKISIKDGSLSVGPKVYPRSTIKGYVLELDTKTQVVKNLVLVMNSSHNIYTFNDTKENVRNFVVELNNHIEMLGEFDQGFLEKMARTFKL